jgi:hypothetical protein
MTVGASPAAASVCGTFSSQKTRDFCSAPNSNSTVVITCADFLPGTGEATHFTQTQDPDDRFGLDKDGDGHSCSDR